MFRSGKLLQAIVLNSASLLVSIWQGLQTDPLALTQMQWLQLAWVLPNSNLDPWSLSQDDDFLLYKNLLYVPNNKDVQLDVLQSHYNHHLVGHPSIL